MAVISIQAFRGMVPRMSKRLLQQNQAQKALNCRITAGRLDPVRKPSLVSTTTLSGSIATIFRYRHFVDGEPVDNWLSWLEDVDVVPSLLANDGRGVFYFTSDGFEPRVSNYAMAVAGSAYPNAWFALGVPSPTTAPSVAPTGGTGPAESRSYAYTFVTAWGEESGPSPASSVVSGNSDGSWAISAMQTAPPNSGTVVGALANTPISGRVTIELNTVFGLDAHESITLTGVVGMTDINGQHRLISVDAAAKKVVVAKITAQVYASGGSWARVSPLNTTGMVKRIYRTAGTNPAFLFVAEVPVASTTYTDTISGTALGEVIATASTLPPPKNLTSLRALPNGCLVGLSGNEVCFSEPYVPYSFPIANRYSFSGIGVDLVPAGNSVIVLTDGMPILFTGSDPQAMSPTTIETYAPCVSKIGVADVGGGALYPSFDGLWLVTPGGAKKITQGLYRDKEWQEMRPETFRAEFLDGQYIAHHQTGGTGRILMVDINEPDSVVEVEDDVDAMHLNEFDGNLYVTKGNQIYLWDGDENNNYSSDWLSKSFQLAKPETFACAQVFAEFGDIAPVDTSAQVANAALMAGVWAGSGEIASAEFLAAEIAGSLLTPVVLNQEKKVQFTVLVNDVPLYSRNVTSSKPFRLPTGYMSDVASIQLQASVPTFSVAMASSIEELREVAP